ncbi:DUF6266 family protein [Pedobacter frigoris]|uniref:Uncharacterized protein n=1 Tax=Pedobacter frigoris TaxID=2571272 RepID=A0A4U1CMA4_9SPHI|nr:DUF6266 family protein [Pedobacter frigoris]TKC08997.1 hypothetical protein FA047_02560 [Pedobacter frigoris]
MGVLKNGIWGGISGRVGNRIYYMYKGKQVVRMVGGSVPKTPKQLANLQAMKLVVDFLKPIMSFIQAGFSVEAHQKNKVPYHLAVGVNKKQALKGDYPEMEIDYENAVLSIGKLEGLTSVSVSLVGNLEEGFSLRFDWEVSAEEREWPRCDDQVMLMAYFPEELEDNPACFTIAGAERNTGQDVLELPFYIAGKPIEVYVSVISEDRTEVADSRYLGRYVI